MKCLPVFCYVIASPIIAFKDVQEPCLHKIINLFLLLLINIFDFILTVLDFSDDCYDYYVTRFVSQGLYIYCCLAFYSNEHGSTDKTSNLAQLISFLFMLILEFISVGFFVHYYQYINIIGKIGYYFHLINPLENFIYLAHRCLRIIKKI